MTKNLSGAWTGEIAGTNTGGMLLELVHESDRIYGHGRFLEPAVGFYEYEIQGVRSSLFVHPYAPAQSGPLAAELKRAGYNVDLNKIVA